MPDGNRVDPCGATGIRPVYDPDMVRLGGRTEVAAIDARPFLAALPELLAGWRALTFVDGVVRHPVTERAHAGLQVVDGRHPYPGVAYRLVLREDQAPAPTAEEAAVAARLVHADAMAATEWERGRIAAARATGRMTTTWHTYAITLEADERERTCFTVHHTGTDTRARVELSPGPVGMLLEVPGWLGARGLLSGVVSVRMSVDLSRLPPYGNEEPQLVATVTHPRGLATGELAVAPAAPGRWTVTTRASVRGVGWLRPVVGLLGPLVKSQVQRGLDDFLGGLPVRLETLQREIAARYPTPPDPRTLAGQVLADLISTVPATVPAPA
ncbi:hypothetical protein [Actinoplanes auranticolor]|uniref:Uncharacterized protein n=1 Tax=Actinoplanes auranticolor TaxID=47988 RepID=A0A919SJT4_9ACTN|nr:hypothetical protein [Actinoplanes auranticolor]GIM72812.1 hypothetical protein Aau02nite_52950 [Actinoplanes auranticolor]